MKSVIFLLGTGMILLLVGCSSTPVILAPVGPNPAGVESMASQGKLQVFSGWVGRTEGDNPTWYQHTSYFMYDLHGKMVRHVDNTIGRYEQAPCRVALPAGRYLVKAKADDYLWVAVPVTIEGGRTTRVHLADNWKTALDASKSALVNMPNGNPIGWRAD